MSLKSALSKYAFFAASIVLIIILGYLFFLYSSSKSKGSGHEQEILEGKKIVEGKIGCDVLNEEQLEAVGEYLMERMHPGELHELVHKMMGLKEGTEYHSQFHINLAKRMYCNSV
jgi:hypothetical protein